MELWGAPARPKVLISVRPGRTTCYVILHCNAQPHPCSFTHS